MSHKRTTKLLTLSLEISNIFICKQAIYDTNGNTYKVGISKDVMYQASGTSNDWSHGEVGIPFCYLIELRSKKHKFKVPKEEIAETGLEILNCVIALMEFVDNYKTPVIGKCEDPVSKSERNEESIKENESMQKSQTDKPEANITRTNSKPSKTMVTLPTVHPQSEVQFSYHSKVPIVHQAEVQVSNHTLVPKQSSHQVEVQVNNLSDESSTSSRPIKVQVSSHFNILSKYIAL